MWIAGFLSLEPAAAKSLVLSGSFIRFHESCSSTKRSGTTAEGFAQIMCLYKLLQLALSFAVAVAMALTITDKTLPLRAWATFAGVAQSLPSLGDVML